MGLILLGNQIGMNIILLGSLLHCIPLEGFGSVPTSPQILPNLYSICVRICLPQEVRGASNQAPLLPPAAHFAKVFCWFVFFHSVVWKASHCTYFSVMENIFPQLNELGCNFSRTCLHPSPHPADVLTLPKALCSQP